MSESMKGKKHTEETKKRIGEASKGNTYALGIKQSQETIAKRIASRKGYKPSDETKEKMRGNTYRLGKKHSEETKQKMKDSHKVSDRSHIVVNEETKNKMRESAKRGWEKRRGG
jgi:hypothetical protein